MIRKRREECIVFLDDCFDSDSSFGSLCSAGFSVERFCAHFPDERNMGRLSNIKDPKVIQLCYQRGFLLVTTDREMRTTFIEVLKKTDIGVLATANNNLGDDVWAKIIIEQKVRILRHFKKEQRPYFSVIQKSGEIRVETLLPTMMTRRTRPKEQGSK